MFAWRDQYLSYNGPSGPATDPYWNYVSLLENFETPQQTYVDASTNNLAITPVGNTRPSLFTPFSDPSGSMYFDGNGDYGSIPDNSVFHLTGDFTMEAWVYITGGTRRSILVHWPGVVAANCAFAFEVFSNNQIYFSHGIGNTTGFKASVSTVPLNQWVHVAVARQGTSFRFFIAGVLTNTVTLSGSLNNGTGEIRIGSMPTEGNFMNGFISNLRLVNGTALYTATFTPSTTPLTAVTNTALLVNATNQGYPTNSLISDQSKNAFTVTATGSPVFSGLSPFTNTYPGSISFISASSQYLTVATNAAFTYGTGDFTIECWVRFTTLPGSDMYLIDQRNSGVANAVIPTIFVNSSNLLRYRVNGSNQIQGTTTLVTNTWYHVAIARSGTSTKMFLNGVQDGSTYTDSNNYAASRVTIGSQGDTAGNYLNGYISNVRLSKGFCYYTTAFTPSTTPLPISSTYTSLFISGNLAGGYDLSTQGQLISTPTANAVISTQQKKFGTQSISYTATGYQTVRNSTSLQFSTGDYTIEGWVYRNASGATHSIICKGGGTTGWLLQINSSNQLVWTSGTTALKTSTTTIAATTWTYFAITRSGTTGYMFINGTLEGSSFTDSTDYNQTDNMLIGADRSSANGLAGYLDDIRITTGICRYTSSFSAPSQSFPTS